MNIHNNCNENINISIAINIINNVNVKYIWEDDLDLIDEYDSNIIIDRLVILSENDYTNINYIYQYIKNYDVNKALMFIADYLIYSNGSTGYYDNEIFNEVINDFFNVIDWKIFNVYFLNIVGKKIIKVDIKNGLEILEFVSSNDINGKYLSEESCYGYDESFSPFLNDDNVLNIKNYDKTIDFAIIDCKQYLYEYYCNKKEYTKAFSYLSFIDSEYGILEKALIEKMNEAIIFYFKNKDYENCLAVLNPKNVLFKFNSEDIFSWLLSQINDLYDELKSNNVLFNEIDWLEVIDDLELIVY